MTKKKKKRSLVVKIIMAFVLVIVIAMVAVSAYLAYGIYTEFNSSGEGTDETVILEIEPGESVWDIAAKLQEKDLIKYQVSFYLKAKDTGLSGKLRYGEFAIRKGTGLANILKILTSGGAWKDSAMFTVPEGYTIELIARRLERDGICTAAEFLEAVELEYDYWFLKDIPEVEGIKYKLQGFLYPETYAISKDMDAEDIVRVMLNQFDKMFTQEMREKLESSGKTVFEIVTAASIIERETVIQSEKPIMAGVIANRLAIDMKLQMCPTALYPVTEGLYGKTTVTYDDIAIDSPYNTYKYKGLPVGPISCPSISSIEAALNPAEHKYLYYHRDNKKNDGSHIFSETYKEHQETQ